MEDFILKCVEMGVHGADMTAYWFKSSDGPGNINCPKGMSMDSDGYRYGDRAYLRSLRHLAFKNSTDSAFCSSMVKKNVE
jgi:hypothetical protein